MTFIPRIVHSIDYGCYPFRRYGQFLHLFIQRLVKFFFDKNLLFNGKSIRKEKGTVKEKKRAKGKETKGIHLKKTGLCVSEPCRYRAMKEKEGQTTKN